MGSVLSAFVQLWPLGLVKVELTYISAFIYKLFASVNYAAIDYLKPLFLQFVLFEGWPSREDGILEEVAGGGTAGNLLVDSAVWAGYNIWALKDKIRLFDCLKKPCTFYLLICGFQRTFFKHLIHRCLIGTAFILLYLNFTPYSDFCLELCKKCRYSFSKNYFSEVHILI